MSSDIISKAILCSLHPSVEAEEFEDFIARKVEVYPLYDSGFLLQSDGVYRLGLLGKEEHVKEIIKGVSDKVGGWGGRVEDEIQEPRFSPARRLGR
jgi:hypothetical protein